MMIRLVHLVNRITFYKIINVKNVKLLVKLVKVVLRNVQVVLMIDNLILLI